MKKGDSVVCMCGGDKCCRFYKVVEFDDKGYTTLEDTNGAWEIFTSACMKRVVPVAVYESKLLKALR